MPSINRRWLTYWKKTLQYADIKPIDFINDPIILEQFSCPSHVPKPLAQKLWIQAQAKKEDSSIEVALCPVQSKIVVEEQSVEDESADVFWIIVQMNKEGKLFVSPDDKPNPPPFFVRDYLSPNPKDNIALASIETVDKVLSSFKFDSQTWQKHWQECEDVFRKVTQQDFNQFNSFDKCHLYIEVAPLRGVARNILALYDHLLEKESPADSHTLLSAIITDKSPPKQPYPSAPEVLYNPAHVGQFSGQFPLSRSQRVSMCGFIKSSTGDVIAVNGPPGTGKTTLLQSIVANLTVQRVLNDEPPALILASSTNNQAITNILTGFALPDDDTLLTKRWLPDIPSLGLYMSGKNSNDYLMYDLKSNRTTGFFSDYEQRPLAELESYFIQKCSQYLQTPIRSVEHAKRLLKAQISQRQQQIKASLNTAIKMANTHNDLAAHGFKNLEDLIETSRQLQQQYNSLSTTILAWEESQEALHQAYDGQSFFAKLLRFLPRFKQRRASQFKRIVSKVDESVLEVTDWSNHFHIIERIDSLLIEYNQQYREQGNKAESLAALTESICGIHQAWLGLLSDWNTNYQDKLVALYKMTGEEYQDLTPQEDINIRLDISYRYEAFWLSLHYREADYLEQLSERTGKVDAEFGKETYQKKLQRYACLTPIFIATFHSAPRFSQYFNPKTSCTEPCYELYDYLIVDEAGQVSPDVALPTFALAKTALIVGDTKQIEPVHSVSEPMDTINYGYHIMRTPEAIDESLLDLHKTQGKLGSSGSLMQIAQHANHYQKKAIKPVTNKAATGQHVTNGLLLTEHRRCLDQLISYSNDYIYFGELEPKQGRIAKIKLDFIKGNKGYVHIDYVSERRGKSRINRLEAAAIAAWIAQYHDVLVAKYDKPIHDIVAVVTPYKPQSLDIKATLQRYNPAFSRITVGTVHALQGAERAIVLFSLVASPQDGLSFLNRQYNLLNVTISRAKDYFVFFGNMNTLAMTGHTPLGNLRRWLLENPDAEITNNFVYDLIAETKTADIYPGLVAEHINTTERHQRILEASCDKALGELIIVSPFLSINALSDSLQNKMTAAIKKHTRIIVYCDVALDNDKNTQQRNIRSQKAIARLEQLGVTVKFINGIHSKTILFETNEKPVIIEGSFNWLSAVRDESNDYNRYEASIVLSGEDLKPRLEEIKKQFEERSKTLKK